MDAAPQPVAGASSTSDSSIAETAATAGDAQGGDQRPAARPAVDDLPDWLRDLNAWSEEQPQPLPLPPASASSQGDAPTESVAATQHELPAWLRADMAELEATPTTDESPADVPTLPAWLANDPDANERARPAPPADAAPASETPTVAGLPSWLVATPSAAPPTANREPSEPKPPADPPVSTMPRWLLDDDEDDVLPSQTASMATVSVDEQPTEPALPSWLRDPQPTPQDDDAAPSWEQAEALRQDGADAAPVADGDAGARIYDQAPTESVPAPVAPSTEPGLPDWLLDTTPAAQNDQSVPPQGANWLAGTPSDRTEPALPSWLYDQDTPPVTASPAADAEPAADATPSWLLDTPTEVVAPPPAAAASEQPDWLRVLGQADDEQAAQPHSTEQSRDASATPAAAQAAPDEPRLPDWLRPTPEEEAAAAQVRPSEPEDDVPEWLRDFTTSQPPLVVEQAEPRPVDQWLTDTGPEPPSFAALPIPASNESRARIYDVRDTDTEIEAATPREPSSPLPAWLVGQNADTGEEPWALPPWLNEADTPPNQPAAVASPASTTANGNLPAWLQDDGTTPASATNTPPIVSSSIPDWLHAQDTATAPQRAAATATGQPAIPAMPVPDAATVMDRVVAEPAPEPVAAAPVPVRRRSSWLPAILALIAFALIIAVIVYALLGFGTIPFLGSASAPPIASTAPLAPNAQPRTAAVARWREHLAQLAPDAPVLVVYATDGSRAAELAPLEAGLIAELRQRGTPLALLATDAQGALLSRRAAERAYTTSSASPVIDLGYQPGGALALARLARDGGSIFERTATGRPLRDDAVVSSAFCGGATAACSLGGFGMTIVLADQSDDARTWVEQVGSVYPDMSLVFAVPAENAPAVQPYIISPRMMMLAGLPDAVALTPDVVRSGVPLSRYGDAVALGGAAWGIMALVGAIPALLGGWSRRRRGQGDPWQR